MVFVGNPFSGVTSAPELLPGAVDRLGQWLPPGAGANLLRSTAYFHGNGAGGHLAVLIAWSVAGLSAVFVGHHTSIRFAAHPARYASATSAPRHDAGTTDGGEAETSETSETAETAETAEPRAAKS
jgi:hypothetical protein